MSLSYIILWLAKFKWKVQQSTRWKTLLAIWEGIVSPFSGQVNSCPSHIQTKLIHKRGSWRNTAALSYRTTLNFSPSDWLLILSYESLFFWGTLVVYSPWNIFFQTVRVCVCTYTVLASGIFSYSLLHFKKPYFLNSWRLSFLDLGNW